MPNSDLVQSLLKGLDLLKLVSLKKGGARLNELALETGIKSRLCTICSGLCVRADFLSKMIRGDFISAEQFWKSLKISRLRSVGQELLISVLPFSASFRTMW